jgi:hypothetical protein
MPASCWHNGCEGLQVFEDREISGRVEHFDHAHDGASRQPGAGREGRDRCDQLAGLAEVFAVEPAADLVGDAECVAG